MGGVRVNSKDSSFCYSGCEFPRLPPPVHLLESLILSLNVTLNVQVFCWIQQEEQGRVCVIHLPVSWDFGIMFLMLRNLLILSNM